jgi:hypothetical protein
MSEKIESALTDEEWTAIRTGEFPRGGTINARLDVIDVNGGDFAGSMIPAVIAALNDKLEDSDPRKITREKIARLRDFLGRYAASLGPTPADHDSVQAILAGTYEPTLELPETRFFLKALESYLPPQAT